ncbi:MAG: hypothetical protein ACHWZW_02940 [Spirulina sp.]
MAPASSTTEAAITALAQAQEHRLPSGLTLRLRPMTGELYLKYQAKSVGFALKGGGNFSAANQWLATQIFEVADGGDTTPLDLSTLTMGLDFDDVAVLSAIMNDLLAPQEPDEGHLPSGLPIERLKPKGQDFWRYQDAIGAAVNSKTGQVTNGEALVAANLALATKMFVVDGQPVTEAWLRGASFQDAAYLLGEVGKRIAATRPPST